MTDKIPIVAVQRRGKDIIVSIPVKCQHIVDGIDHMKCIVVGDELHYVAVR